jgi:hypothetical protein
MNKRFTFGKHKGEFHSDVAKTDPQYIMWVRDNLSKYKISDDVVSLAISTGILLSEIEADNYGTAGDFGFDEY